ncbi:hypothetical protein QYM36_012168 [Artemia franciscana]|uniref:Uncharacterized protein n=1 Tax=Artemia franciscana TaxID=6661 RepID=A0AA88L335_ARTSF|nr:hypothetical protein QYM36_012168 [Artemia franciscana]
MVSSGYDVNLLLNKERAIVRHDGKVGFLYNKDALKSISIPFVTVKGVDLVQPVFSASYLKGRVKAQPYGNFEGAVKFKLFFKHGGATELGEAMLAAVTMDLKAAEAAGCLKGGQMQVSTEAPGAFQGVQPSAPAYQNSPPDYAPPPYSEAPPNSKQDGTPYGFG